MNLIKKLLTVVIALVMMLGLGVTAMADGDEPVTPTSGSVTVNPNFKDQTYTLYKLFDAKITFNDQGVQQAVTYQLPSGKTAEDLIYTDGNGGTHQWFKLNDNNNVVPVDESVKEDWAKDPNAIAWAKDFGIETGSPIEASEDNDSNVKWENLSWGYYFVTTTTGSFIGVDTNNPNVKIEDKNTKPTVDKEITNVTNGNVFNATEDSEKTDPSNGVNEQAIAQIGSTVSYKLTIKVQPGAQNYIITDTMTNLKIVANSFKIGGEELTGNNKIDSAGTTIADGASTFTIKLAQSYLDSITEETNLVITYDAVLDTTAIVASEANPNAVTLTYGTNPEDNKSEDSAKVWTAEINVEKKIDKADGEPLEGAGFKLKNAEGKFYKFNPAAVPAQEAQGTEGEDGYVPAKATEPAGVVWVDESEADEIITGSDGKLDEAFKGLANGTYTLVESTIPDGYNKLEDTVVTIADDNVTINNLSQTKTVINNAGSELPSTGGMGTTLFYVLGTVLVAAAGILLVSRRRMSE